MTRRPYQDFIRRSGRALLFPGALLLVLGSVLGARLRRRPPEISSTTIAFRVAAALGITPPRNAAALR